MDPTVLTNASVLSCDRNASVATTLAVADGRVVAVGGEDEVRAAAGTTARTVDLDGATVLPGFVDTHPHLLHFGALAEPLVDITDARTHDDIVERIAARAATAAPGEWIMTTPVGEPHYFIRRSWRDLSEGELPDRTVLDRAAPHNPVFIQAWAPVVPNVCTMNTLALQRLGVTAELPDRIDNVWIDKDDEGEPTGRLHGSVTNYYCDSEFMIGLLRKLPLLDATSTLRGAERAMRAANATGVTTIYEAHLMTFGLIDVYRHLRRKNRLTLRVQCVPEAEPVGVPWADPTQPDDYLERLARAGEIVDRSDDMFRVEGLAISPYGPCWPGFTLMREPYSNPYGDKTLGRIAIESEQVGQTIRYCHDHGLRLNIIASGLAEIDSHLEQLEALGQQPRTPDGRPWLLQHFYFAEPALVARAAALELDITTTMSFSWGKGEIVRERFGEKLLDDFIPLARLLDAGLHVAAGTDWGPKNVFEHLALAIEPRYGASGRRAATPGINRHQALNMWTRDAAHVIGWTDIGSLEAGNHADLLIVDRNPLTCSIDDLPGTQILSTVLGGRTVSGQHIID